MSVGAARRLGVPEDQWVFLHGHADLRAPDLLDREDLSSYPTAVLAVRHALEVAGADLDDVTFLDLYSCFPVAVSTVLEGLDLDVRRPTGPHPHRRPAVLRRCRQQLLDARRSRRPCSAAGPTRRRSAWSPPTAACRRSTPSASTPRGRHRGAPTAAPSCRTRSPSWPVPAFTEHPEGWASIETYAVRLRPQRPPFRHRHRTARGHGRAVPRHAAGGRRRDPRPARCARSRSGSGSTCAR